MAEVVTLTAHAQVLAQASSQRDSCGRQHGTLTGFLKVIWFTPISNIAPLFHTHFHTTITNAVFNTFFSLIK
jgi:hypothetical protein